MSYGYASEHFWEERTATRYPHNPPRLVQVVAPSEEPITLEEVKAHLRIDFVPEFSDGVSEDTLLRALIGVARKLAENYTGRALMPQVWKQVRERFAVEMRLAYPPIQSLTVRYRDTAGVWMDLAPSQYTLSEGDYPIVYPAKGVTYPTVYEERNAVELVWQCGYGSAADVPLAIKQWMLLKVGELYETRERSGTAEMKTYDFVDGLLNPYRVVPVPYVEAYAR